MNKSTDSTPGVKPIKSPSPTPHDTQSNQVTPGDSSHDSRRPGRFHSGQSSGRAFPPIGYGCSRPLEGGEESEHCGDLFNHDSQSGQIKAVFAFLFWFWVVVIGVFYVMPLLFGGGS